MVTTRLNALAHKFPATAAITTALYGVWNPPERCGMSLLGTCRRWSGSGRRRVTSVFLLAGTSHQHHSRCHLRNRAGSLYPGETQIAYIDGLVERRGESPSTSASCG